MARTWELSLHSRAENKYSKICYKLTNTYIARQSQGQRTIKHFIQWNLAAINTQALAQTLSTCTYRCSYRSDLPCGYLIAISAWALPIKPEHFPPIWSGSQPCCKSRKWLQILINLSSCEMAMHWCTIAQLQLTSDDCSYTMGQTGRYPSVMFLAFVEVTLVHVCALRCFIH